MSSGEIIRQGPLDIVRSINHQALELEQWVGKQLAADNLHALSLGQDNIMLIDELLPVHSQDVVIEGTRITRSTNPADELHWLLPDQTDYPTKTPGKHIGYDLLELFDEITGMYVVKSVHKLLTEEKTVWTERGTETEQAVAFVAVEGSLIEPIEPVNAHSYQDIHNDKLIEQFGTFIFKTDIPLNEKLARLIGMMESSFGGDIGEEDEKRNWYRTSFLNSVNLFGEYRLAVPYTLSTIAAPETEYHGTMINVASGKDDPIALKPDIFTIDARFEYEPGKTEPVVHEDSREWYVRGKLDDGMVVSSPLKSVIGVLRRAD